MDFKLLVIFVVALFAFASADNKMPNYKKGPGKFRSVSSTSDQFCFHSFPLWAIEIYMIFLFFAIANFCNEEGLQQTGDDWEKQIENCYNYCRKEYKKPGFCFKKESGDGNECVCFVKDE